MLGLVLACGLVAADPGPTGAGPDWSSYEEAKAHAGHDAAGQVALALWCERHGMEAERTKHLALAVLADPTHAEARRLLGLPPRREAADEARTAVALAAYNARREKTPRTADARWDLAVWCAEQGLKAEATAHFAEVVRLDPARTAAWKRLGYKKHSGRWMTDEQIAEQAEQDKADKLWGSRLTALHKRVHRGPRRDEAEATLASLDDPRAAPAVYREFGLGGALDQRIAVQVLGQMDDPKASKLLASLAVYGASDEVRRRATEALRGHDADDFVAELVGLLVDPLKYEVRPVGGPGSPGVLFVEGERYNVRRFYAPPPPPNLMLRPGDFFSADANGLPVINRPMVPIRPIQQRITPDGTPIDGPIASPPTPAAVAGALPPGLTGGLGGAGTAALSAALGAAGSIGEVTTPVIQISPFEAALETRRAALSSQAQLQQDINRIEAVNRDREEFRDRVVMVLKETTDEDGGETAQDWKRWLGQRRGYATEEPKEPPKPTMDLVLASPYQPTFGHLSVMSVLVPVVKVVDT